MDVRIFTSDGTPIEAVRVLWVTTFRFSVSTEFSRMTKHLHFQSQRIVNFWLSPTTNPVAFFCSSGYGIAHLLVRRCVGSLQVPDPNSVEQRGQATLIAPERFSECG